MRKPSLRGSSVSAPTSECFRELSATGFAPRSRRSPKIVLPMDRICSKPGAMLPSEYLHVSAVHGGGANFGPKPPFNQKSRVSLPLVLTGVALASRFPHDEYGYRSRKLAECDECLSRCFL